MDTLEMLDKNEIPVEMPYLYKDTIQDHLLIYKPRGDHAFLLLDQRAQKIFFTCNGQRTILEICSLLDAQGYQEREVLLSLAALEKEQVLNVQNAVERGRPLYRESPKIKSFGIWLHITNACNLRCSYCYIDKDKGNMAISVAEKTVENVVAQCEKYGITNLAIKFAGGEPLMAWKNIMHIVDFTRRMCSLAGVTPSFDIVSNGTLITEDIATYLVDNRISCAISLDGVKEVNDKQRAYINGRGSFTDVERGIQTLQEAGRKPFVLITVTENNIDDLQELTNYLLRQGLSFRYSLVRDCEQMSTQSLLQSSERYRKVLHKCFDDIDEWMLNKNWDFDVKLCDVNLHRPITRACGAGHASAAINHNGEVALCQMVFDTPIGNINRDGLIESVRTQQAMPDFREWNIDHYIDCSQCIWKNVCAGGCPVFTIKQFGRIDVPSPYCQTFQSLIPRVVRLQGIKLLRDYAEKGGRIQCLK